MDNTNKINVYRIYSFICHFHTVTSLKIEFLSKIVLNNNYRINLLVVRRHFFGQYSDSFNMNFNKTTLILFNSTTLTLNYNL